MSCIDPSPIRDFLPAVKLNLLGLWRKGSKYRTRLTRETFRAGDVLLLGVRDLAEEDVSNKIKHLGLMPLRQRELQTIPSRSRLIKGIDAN